MRNFVTVLTLAFTAVFARAQAPSFEVASIKPSEPVSAAMMASGRIHMGMKVDGARVDIGRFSLIDLISRAYEVKPYQVFGPGWLGTQRFDILATLPEGAKTDQVPEMLQQLLVERFKLAIHRDTKENSVYALVVAKAGPKLKEAETASDANAPAGDPGGSGQITVTRNPGGGGAIITDGKGSKTRMSMAPDGRGMRLENSNMTMAELADALSRFVDHPIVDLTGLKGNYQVMLDVSMQDILAAAQKAGVVPNRAMGQAREGMNPGDAAAEPAGGSILHSLEMLGLRLESRKMAVERIVVDHVEQTPTEN